MPGLGISATVKHKGSIWNRVIGREVDVYSEEISKKVADRGQELVLEHLGQSLKTRTPYYETQIAVEPSGSHEYRVTDSGVIYGPWLEGIGSRNAPVTSFPGYFSFRTARAELEKEVPAIARVVMRGLEGV